MNTVGQYVIEVEPQHDLPYVEANELYGASRRPMLFVKSLDYRRRDNVDLTVHRSEALVWAPEDIHTDETQGILHRVTGALEQGTQIILPKELTGYTDYRLPNSPAFQARYDKTVKLLNSSVPDLNQSALYEVCLNEAQLTDDGVELFQMETFKKYDEILIGLSSSFYNKPLFVEDKYNVDLLQKLPMVVRFEQTSRLFAKDDVYLTNEDAINVMYEEQDGGAGQTCNPGRILFPEGNIRHGSVVDVVTADGVGRGRIDGFDYHHDDGVFVSVIYDDGGPPGTRSPPGSRLDKLVALGLEREVVRISYGDLERVMSDEASAVRDALTPSTSQSHLTMKFAPVEPRTPKEWAALYTPSPLTSVAEAYRQKVALEDEDARAVHKAKVMGY